MARRQLGPAPTLTDHTATKGYVDTQISTISLTPGASGASGVPGASGEPGASGVPGAPGASGPAGASGASGASGGTGGTGASGSGTSRSIQLLTSNATLGSAAGTEYVIYSNIATVAEVPATGDGTNYASTTAILHLDGSNNATTPLTDNSAIAANWTASGTAKLSTEDKKFGTASLIVDGSGYIVPSAASSNYDFSGDFTVEFWYKSSQPASARTTYLLTGPFYVYIEYAPAGYNGGTNGQLIFTKNDFGSFIFGGGGSGQSQTGIWAAWNHIAVCRSGTSTRMFFNGTQCGSTLSSDSTSYSGTGLSVGGGASLPNTTNPVNFNGYIDDIRITKGVARYTSNFTAPTAAFPDSGTATIPAVPPALTMPAVNNDMYRIWNLNSESLSVKPQSGQTIDGATGIALAQNDKKLLLSDGATGWRAW